MKKYFYLATALVALAACSSNDYVGDQEALNSAGQIPISFSGGTPSMTRATGATAVGVLSNNFVLFGYKTVGSTTQTVFDNYQVNFIGTSAYTSKSNSAGWEYVSYKNLPNGVGTNDGVTAFAATTTGDPNNSTAIDQSVKYWDFNATNYNFFAYSLGAGTGTPKTWAKASAMTNSTFTLEGTADQLGTCYISNKKTMAPTTGSTEVELEFRAISSKIELKFYETIPGYSIKDVKFYVDDTNKSTGDADKDGLRPALYNATASIPTGGTFTITFDSKNFPVVAFTSADGYTNNQFVEFNKTSSDKWLDYTTKEYKEANGDYLGRMSNEATPSAQISVLPNDNGVALTLKMDYTLVSRDGSGESIQVTGATATIPAAYTKWRPNYAYTYIFKITDDKLVPITLDAVVADAQDGTQETVTTVDDPSITTYAKGVNSTAAATAEYPTNKNIYVVVDKNGTVQALTVGTSANLYTAEIEADAVQGITESSVANAIATNSDGYDFGTVLAVSADLAGYYEFNGSGYVVATTPADGERKYYKPVTASVKDANGKKLVIKAQDGLTAVTAIPATDSPTGVDLTVNGAKFTPAAAGTYVFEYIQSSDNTKHYKVIKVVPAGS